MRTFEDLDDFHRLAEGKKIEELVTDANLPVRMRAIASRIFLDKQETFYCQNCGSQAGLIDPVCPACGGQMTLLPAAFKAIETINTARAVLGCGQSASRRDRFRSVRMSAAT